MTEIEQRHTESAPEFLAFLRLSAPHWRGYREFRTPWVFRGQGNADWGLQPSAFRPLKDGSLPDLYRQYRLRSYLDADWRQWANPSLPSESFTDSCIGEVALDAFVHTEMVRRFVLFADHVNHPVNVEPVLWHLPSQNEDALSRVVNGTLTNREIEMFAVAQHHGVPTGLLDWTYNPLIAAYFAADGAPSSADRDRIAVWAIWSDFLDIDLPLRRLTVRAGLSPFLDAQAGLFTWCPQAYLLRIQHGRYIPFDELVAGCTTESRFSGAPRPFIMKVTMPSSERDLLLQLLWRERVTPAHLMPTFDNIRRAMEIEAGWLFASD